VKIGTGITVTSALSTGFSCKCCTWTCPENPRPVNPCNSQNSYAHPVQIIFHDNKLYIYIDLFIYSFICLFNISAKCSGPRAVFLSLCSILLARSCKVFPAILPMFYVKNDSGISSPEVLAKSKF
jgi:hypothetical protein